MEIVAETSFDLLFALEECKGDGERTLEIKNYIENIDKKPLTEIPDFAEGLEWFNADAPLSLRKNLRGKITVLDFFTYCCINCMHILPDLEFLESKFKDTNGVVVLGVHSAKFDNEKVSANVLSAVLRYNISHPVVNDVDNGLWKELGIACWPTLVVLDPQNRPLLSLMGEGHRNLLVEFVTEAVEFYKAKGQVTFDEIGIRPNKHKLQDQPLLFPGKISIDERGRRLAISDTGHHRILVVDTNGLIQYSIGGPERGLKDGGFDEARFYAPQGTAWQGDVIYLADTENHAIRKIDLASQRVTTLTGTGYQGNDKVGGATGTSQPISSPWDVSVGVKDKNGNSDLLYISMAGTHQIWAYVLQDTTLPSWVDGRQHKKGTCLCIAGSGNEENKNNLYPQKAAFAQPSGITLGMVAEGPDPLYLFVADSESSTVRYLHLDSGAVQGLVGGTKDPRNLFSFGDKDGKGINARLQHPLGVTLYNKNGGPVLVADSYNHKIKSVDILSHEVITVEAITGLNEPGGLCMHSALKHLYIADTNNHLIKVYDFEKSTIHQLPIIQPVKTQVGEDVVDAAFKRLTRDTDETIQLDSVSVTKGTKLNIQLDVQLSEGLHLTEGAPSAWQIWCDDCSVDDWLSSSAKSKNTLEDLSNQPVMELTVPKDMTMSSASVNVECLLYLCDSVGVCMMRGLVFKIPVSLQEGSPLNTLTVQCKYTVCGTGNH